MRRIAAVVVASASLLIAASTAQAAPPAPFGHECTPRSGVLFCPTNTLADRIPSFDGTPLDVDVTLPLGTEAGQPLPTIVMLHGYGGNKGAFERDDPEGGSSTTYRYNNNYYAKQGYAVVNYTARGFGRSCGKQENSASTPDCLARKSYVHLADQRWEARDTQYLLGRLVDEGVTSPQGMGVTGISYGGGQSLELAYLRDRIRREDGSFEQWTSPNGTPLSLAAAWPRWLWSDLVGTLLPNGRFLDSVPATTTQSYEPFGIKLESYVDALYATGLSTGTYCGTPPRPGPCTDPTADLTAWLARVSLGEPYDLSAPFGSARPIAEEITEFHQGFGLEGATPSPLLLQDGWTDDLFPARESIRVYNDVSSRTPVSMQFGDLGHSRGSNKANADHYFNDQGAAFFDRYLKGTADPNAPAPGSVTAFTQTCPRNAPANGPFKAASYAELPAGRITFGGGSAQTVSSAGGNPQTGAAIDPVAGGGDACRRVNDETAPGTAVVRGPESRGYTLLGLPTVRATISTTGSPYGQLDSRLWDVAPDGRQMLVSRGAYRLTENQSGRITFQLYGNGWCFAPGHRPKLELLGKDEPYLRPSNPPPFQVQVSDVQVRLPTAEAKARGCSSSRG
jgi:X-Pro dipeptidyl-peptidase (S15 family)